MRQITDSPRDIPPPKNYNKPLIHKAFSSINHTIQKDTTKSSLSPHFSFFDYLPGAPISRLPPSSV
ncbi:hypothetical protein BLAT2472_90125 [Burkholderia latens]